MARGHAIEVLSFEVAFATEDQARAQHMRVGDFAATRGLAVIEEVFDEFAAAGETVRLDQLEVDLGETPLDWSEAEAEQRLREALRQALRNAIGPRRDDGPPRAVPEGDTAELEAVWRHLQDGLLPWNLASADRAAFDELVLRVVVRHAATLAERLRTAPAPRRLITRLVRQWPEAAVEALAGRLDAPSSSTETAVEASPERWAEQLAARLGLDSGSVADGLAATVEEAAWPRLINGEPAVVRTRLRALGRSAEQRARLAALLTDDRQRQVLSLWAADADVNILQALLAVPRAWRLGAPMADAAVLRILREGLLAHVLAAPGDTLQVDAAVEALVVARARADGLAPGPIARALVAAWPSAGPHAATGARLRAALSTRGLAAGPEAAQPETAPPARGWRFDVAPSDTPDDHVPSEAPWRRRLRLEPAGIADQLRRMGRTVDGRRRLARDLTPARLSDVLALFAQPADADLVRAVVESPGSWTLGLQDAASIALRLRQWLLDDLLLAPPGPPRDAADLILALVRRRALYDDLAVEVAARALLGAWPAEGAAGAVREQLRRILGTVLGEVPEVVATPADAALPARPPAPGAGATTRDTTEARSALAAALDVLDIPAAVAPLRILLADDRAWLAEELGRRTGDRRLVEALAAELPAPLRFELVQPGLSEPALRLLLAFADEATPRIWAEVIAAVWARAPGGRPLAAAALAHRLRISPDARARLAQVLQTAGAYVRDEPSTPIRQAPGPPPPVALADWRGRLPDRPSAATVRALSALLTPAAAGLRALTDHTEAERGVLITRLRPTDAPAALGAVRMLTTAARAIDLTPPPEGWETFGWRAVLRELFEEGRVFEAAGFTARWFEAWSAVVPPGVAPPARGRLALALETLPLARLLRRAAEASEAPTLRADGTGEPPTGPRDTFLHGPLGAFPSDAELASRSAGQPPSPPAQRPPPSPGSATAPTPPRPDIPEPPADEETPTHPPVARPAGWAASTDIVGAAANALRTDDVTQAAAPTAAQPGPPELGPTDDRAAAAPDLAPSDTLPDPAALAAALRPTEPAALAAEDAAELETDDTIYVDNAGLVLAGPFIPMLLNRLELTRGGRFVDDRSRERAIHVLQFLVSGEDEPAPEHRLALNKLVCGLDFPIPVGRDVRLEDHERALVDSLLRTIIERWSTLGRTSVAGLRETFLMRRGALRPHEEAWRLTVEPGPFDMLLDRIPWGYGLLKLPWMAQVLHVDWR